MATKGQRLLLGALVVLTAASVWRAAALERDKHRIARAYTEAQQMVKQLSDERAHLNDELVDARQTVEGQAGHLANLEEELKAVQGRLDATTAEIASLQREHEQLREHNTSLATQLSSALTEKQALERKLSSLKELKLAIHDIKRKMWRERWAAWQSRIDTIKRQDQERLAMGNRGYVVRGGQSTISSGAKLQVHVLDPQAQ